MDISVALIKAVVVVCMDSTSERFEFALPKEALRIKGMLMHFMTLIDDWSIETIKNNSNKKQTDVRLLYNELVNLTEILEAATSADASWRYKLLRQFVPAIVKRELQDSTSRLKTEFAKLNISMIYDVNKILYDMSVQRKIAKSVNVCYSDGQSLNVVLGHWNPSMKDISIDIRKLKYKKEFSQQIGQGGSAQVFSGMYSTAKLKISVAVKLINIQRYYNVEKDMTDTDFAKECERVMGETIRMKHACIHSNIVGVYGCFIPSSKSDLPLIVMELLDTSLKSIIHDKNVIVQSFVVRLKLIVGIVNAIKFLHIQGIIHQDIKPGNILINSERTVAKLTDFGLADIKKATCETWERRDTIHGTTSFVNYAGRKVAGTLAYVPPEKIVSKDDKASRAADIYALGVTLWECCSGLIPHIDKSDMEVIELAKKYPQPMLLFPIQKRQPTTIRDERDAFALMENAALVCTQRNQSKRPNASDVEQLLTRYNTINNDTVSDNSFVQKRYTNDSTSLPSMFNNSDTIRINADRISHDRTNSTTTNTDPNNSDNTSNEKLLVDFDAWPKSNTGNKTTTGTTTTTANYQQQRSVVYDDKTLIPIPARHNNFNVVSSSSRGGTTIPGVNNSILLDINNDVEETLIDVDRFLARKINDDINKNKLHYLEQQTNTINTRMQTIESTATAIGTATATATATKSNSCVDDIDIYLPPNNDICIVPTIIHQSLLSPSVTAATTTTSNNEIIFNRSSLINNNNNVSNTNTNANANTNTTTNTTTIPNTNIKATTIQNTNTTTSILAKNNMDSDHVDIFVPPMYDIEDTNMITNPITNTSTNTNTTIITTNTNTTSILLPNNNHNNTNDGDIFVPPMYYIRDNFDDDNFYNNNNNFDDEFTC